MTWADDRQAGHLLLSAGVIAGEADVSHMVGRRQLWTKAAMLIGQAESRAHFWLDASCTLNTGRARLHCSAVLTGKQQGGYITFFLDIK